MKKLIKKTLVLIVLLFAVQSAFAQVNSNNHYVSGYTKSNGTYVQGYYRTNPNSTIKDNYTTKPNVNPYTGAAGTISPSYRTTSYYKPIYNTSTYSSYTYSTYSYSIPVYRSFSSTYVVRY